MVEDAVLTNSPFSFRVASSSLLVTPSCLASSCTRSFPGTFLLVLFSEKAHARIGAGLICGFSPVVCGRSSLMLHRMLISVRSSFLNFLIRSCVKAHRQVLRDTFVPDQCLLAQTPVTRGLWHCVFRPTLKRLMLG